MATSTTTLPASGQPWFRRRFRGAYTLAEAAELAGVPVQAAARWRALTGAGELGPVGPRRVFFSWPELIEFVVAAALVQDGCSWREAATLRERASRQLGEPHPFIWEHAATDALSALAGNTADGGPRLQHLLSQFDYEDGFTACWHPAGRQSAVELNPRINFGQPMVQGIKTANIAGRYRGGQPIHDLMDDFVLREKSVRDALAFEGIAVAP